MNVILLERIRHLGQLGDEIQVKAGYGRNYLLPQGKAVLANAKNRAYFDDRRAELEQAENEKLSGAHARAKGLENLQVIITARAGEEGKLYGSVGIAEIVENVTALGKEIHKSEVQMPLGPIRALGEHEVKIHLLHGEVVETIKVLVVPEE